MRAMLAFTRKPPDDDTLAEVELLLADADDDLAPLTSASPVPDGRDEHVGHLPGRASRLVVAPCLSQRDRAAYAQLVRLLELQEPLFGWRRVLFVVSGIRLSPSRSERVFRDLVGVLVRSVDPAILDDEKEAAS